MYLSHFKQIAPCGYHWIVRKMAQEHPSVTSEEFNASLLPHSTHRIGRDRPRGDRNQAIGR